MNEDHVDRTKETIQAIKRKVPLLWFVIAGIVFFILIFFRPWTQIGPGYRGVVLNFGAVQKEVLDEGLHPRVPVMQTIVQVDVKVQKAETDAAAASKDLQDVTSRVALNYHIVPDKANIVYQTLGSQFKERIIDPAIQEVVKAVTANYTAEELITKRPAVSEAMRLALTDRLMANNIAVDAFSIVVFSFSKVFTEAIEAKQTAEQLALKAKRDLERIKIEAEQKITAAKAEAESLKLQKANISPDLIELRRIEANMKAIEKWNGILPQVTGEGAIPMIGLANASNKSKR